MSDSRSTDRVTSLANTSSQGVVKKKSKIKHRKKKHHHKHRRKQESVLLYYDIPGVVHVILDDIAQNTLGCIVGNQVTAEKPWNYIKKENIMEQFDNEEVPPSFTAFIKYKNEITEYPDEDMLIGYLPDESRDFDEFLLCLTNQAALSITESVKLLEQAQEQRLQNTINRVVHPWNTLGSEAEVDENIPKNTRGLYRVELETKYPPMKSEVKFRLRLVNQVRDGYSELLVPSRYSIPNIGRKRIDSAVQISPSVTDGNAQTTYGYPINSWTQYKYEYQPIKKLPKQLIERFSQYFETEFDPLSDDMYINANINLYTDDYWKLNVNNVQPPIHVIATEYKSLKDINKCKGKMITAFAWHPMWTGTVAVAYANYSPNWIKRDNSADTLSEAVHGVNPILIWSFKDGLAPKLILETHSEVQCLCFCPHNENLLIAGCFSGQVAVWDIKNKLNKVEEEEILTPAQQSYRTLMFSLMKWMKNTRDISVIPPTATSELMFAHTQNVTSVCWIHPQFVLTKTGHYERAPDDTESLQFVTSSSDGTIKFWDLTQLPVSVPGEYKPQKKSRRLKKRPSALTLDVSPFRILNRKLRPHYQINLILPKTDVICPITCVKLPQMPLDYEEINPDANRVSDITYRVYYKPIYSELFLPLPRERFFCGTYSGDTILSDWEGYDYLSGDVVTRENAKVTSMGRYHDGPVLVVEQHPQLDNIYISIGGKVVCIWSEELPAKPLFWRRTRHRYTHGHWVADKAGGFRLNRTDGNREIWNLVARSDTFYYEVVYTGKGILQAVLHPRDLEVNIFGLADNEGSLRLVYVDVTPFDEQEVHKTQQMFNANVSRKLDYERWLTDWTKKHASWILEQKEAAIAEQVRKKAEEEVQKLKEEEMKMLAAAEAAKKAKATAIAPPGHYEEWAHEQYILKEQERMGNELLAKKHLDTATLIKQQMPMKKLEAEIERKKLKQRQRLSRADEIFVETISMLFPDMVEDRSLLVQTEEFTKEEMVKIKKKYFDAYTGIKAEADVFVEETPYSYDFDWKAVIATSKAKKRKADFENVLSHKDRLESERTEHIEEIPYKIAGDGNDDDDDEEEDGATQQLFLNLKGRSVIG